MRKKAVTNIEEIAHAFNRQALQLLVPGVYSTRTPVQAKPDDDLGRRLDAARVEPVSLFHRPDDRGRGLLLADFRNYLNAFFPHP